MKKKLVLLIATVVVFASVSGWFVPAANTVLAETTAKTPAKTTVKIPAKTTVKPTAKTTAKTTAAKKKTVASPQNMPVTSAKVTATALNVRQGPSKTYPVVCKLAKGQSVKVFGKLGTWYAVYDSKGGCVGAADAKYLKLSGKTTGTTSGTATGKITSTPSTTTNPAAGTAKANAPKTPGSAPAGISADEQKLLNLVNKARAGAGAGALSFDMKLMETARLKAKDMVTNNYFSHQSPTYGSPFDMMKQFGISFKAAGENIAGNQTVQGAFDAWMKSPGHKKNILSTSFNYTGIGIAASKSYGKILVQQFIGR